MPPLLTPAGAPRFVDEIVVAVLSRITPVSKLAEMPASYHISPKMACIIVRLEGVVTDSDLIEEQRRLFSDPLFKEDYARLVDATEVVNVRVSADTLRAVATAAVERGLRKAALISNNTDLLSELMRMYEGYASPPAEVAVFQNTKEALEWLAKSIVS